MNKLLRALVPAAVMAVAPLASAGEETRKMEKPGFVAMEHLGGTLAVNLERLEGIFYQPASGESPARLRLNFSGSDNKSVGGGAADPLWKSLREGPHARQFLWVSHMGGTLGIPIRSIQSLYKSGEGAALSVRINYPGDPQGKTVQGAEAAEVWKRLAE